MWASILKRNVSYIINHFLNKLVRSRCLVNNNNVARCCVEMLRACGWALRKKGLSGQAPLIGNICRFEYGELAGKRKRPYIELHGDN